MFFLKKLKNKNKGSSSDKNPISDFKEDNAEQIKFNFKESADEKRINSTLGTKQGLSYNINSLDENHIKILKNCNQENTANDLMKILKRTNKTKFKQAILNPLIACGFFELSIPEKITSPNQKYILTNKFVSKKLNNP